MIDMIFNYVLIGLQVIGGASVLLGIIAPLTTNKYDDKVLDIFKKILKGISLHVDEKKIVINLKR